MGQVFLSLFVRQIFISQQSRGLFRSENKEWWNLGPNDYVDNVEPARPAVDDGMQVHQYGQESGIVNDAYRFEKEARTNKLPFETV